MLNNYEKLDEMAIDGMFTVPSINNYDMLGIRKYCKDKNKPYSELTDEEINFFTIRNRNREAI